MPETTVYKKAGKTGYLQYKKLNEFPWLLNAFSTREGGISTGQYAEMNLSFTVGDDPGNVKENFRIFGEAIGVSRENMVLAAQTHTVHVMRATSHHSGMGIVRDRDYDDIDGLVTN